MSAAAATADIPGPGSLPGREPVWAKIRYFNPEAPRGEETNAIELGEPKQGEGKEAFRARRHLVTEPKDVTFWDARNGPSPGVLGSSLASWSLQKHGFACVRAPNTPPDWYDRERVYKEYYPLVEECARKQLPEASRAFVFTHLIRTEDPPNFTSGYSGFTHLDFGPNFEPLWRKLLVHRYKVPLEEAESCGLCLVHTWHPIDRPAYQNPLCLLDYSSVDLQTESLPWRYLFDQELRGQDGGRILLSRRPPEERIPEAAQAADSLGVVYSAKHRWVYCSDMRPDECWLFKQWDTREEAGARASFHCSFHDPFHDAWKECPGRRSVEARILLTFPKRLETSKL